MYFRLVFKGTRLPNATVQFFLNGFKYWLEDIKLFTTIPIGNLFCGFYFGAGLDVFKLCYIAFPRHGHAKLFQQFIIIKIIGRCHCLFTGTAQQVLMVHPGNKAPAFLLAADLIEPGGIKPLKYFSVFTMCRRVPVLLDKTLNFLEPGNNAFFTRRPADSLFRLNLDAQFFEERIIIVCEP